MSVQTQLTPRHVTAAIERRAAQLSTGHGQNFARFACLVYLINEHVRVHGAQKDLVSFSAKDDRHSLSERFSAHLQC